MCVLYLILLEGGVLCPSVSIGWVIHFDTRADLSFVFGFFGGDGKKNREKFVRNAKMH